MFFESWSEIARIVTTTLIIYPFLILATHILGKRSFAKMNNFDWIITVAAGSILGSAILLKDVVIVEVLVAVSLLLFLQYLLTWISAHFSTFDKVVKTSPQLVFFDGEYLEAAMKDTRLTSTEVEASVRKAGFGDLSTVMAVVFEADGELSIVPKSKNYDQLIMKLRNVPD
ncbi:hypothetical protein PC2016_3541 [Pseudoalteromonas carrageenovora]|uniref:YetF C-terminal domain-containing protein n=1 Tax=Pseudoalteromonas carrageenovora IAM 12662 TaxID=1314868 RepID=A0A2K4XET0_PSEVC|nr:YetF domain-containing protein [Pseudoalteromonas carrageenovora]MBE0384447.1 hypothetical protein [Pseudoalteromonas carrageenovora IAM 12662]QBJ73716.1 hypothetical protein PC2016_3541 [Pseudoalteromonas carrageenovora]GEB72608.1 hypothetical protein PCA01_33180 [Pseudoalteromonas carrageenovora]SOU42830.1 conserved membrane protein of unknown function [Pseudoalteromonas carrageenovora IAM 12662]